MRRPRRWQLWWEARHPRTDRLELTHRNLYILPTASGWLFALLLLALLLASINYQLNLGHLLTFSLASAGVVALHATHSALRGLVLQAMPVEPVFAGDELLLEIRLDERLRVGAPWNFGRHGIGLRWRDRPGDETVQVSLPENGPAVLRLGRRTARRGRLELPAIEIDCRFPLGLFRAWSVWRLSLQPLVWPAPEPGAPPLPEPPARDGTARAAAWRHDEDGEHGIRPWRREDRPSQVLWKLSARSLAAGSGLLVRDPPPPPRQGSDLQLDGDRLQGLDGETRLSRLCAWVLAAEAEGRRWRLDLGAVHVGPGHGPVQRRAALDALALWGGRPAETAP